MEEKLLNKQERIVSLDLLRVIAALAVVMIHISSSFVFGFPNGSSRYLWGNVFDSLARIGVPVFIMISGALMLNENKNITLGKIWKKYILNIVVLLLFWSFVYTIIYNIVFPYFEGETISLKTIVHDFIMGHFHMWYLYMIIGLYAITPVLRLFVKKENKNLVLYLILLISAFVFFKPILGLVEDKFFLFAWILEFIDSFYLDSFGAYAIYYLLGWYIIHIGFNKKTRITLYGLGVCALTVMILLVQFIFVNREQIEAIYLNKNIFVLLYSTALFVLVNQLYTGKGFFGKAISSLSKLSFGVYIIHILVLFTFRYIFPNSTYPFLYLMAEFICVSIGSFLISFVISKIPFIKKVIKA